MDRPSSGIGTGTGAALLGVSGFAALLYETAWTRLFESLLGHTTGTTATVVAAFLGGLALGSLLASRLESQLRKPLAVYAGLELLVALWVAALPAVIRGGDVLGRGLFGTAWAAPGAGDLLRWVLAFVLVLVPASAMGATLPLIAAAVRSVEDRTGPVIGRLYAANTAGAVLGTVAAGFVTIRFLGVERTVLVGVAAGGGAALAALLLAGRGKDGASREGGPGTASGAGHPGPGWIHAVLAVSGAVSLALEILWLRLFVFPLGGNVMTFATVVGSLLGAVATGSWLGARLARDPDRAVARLAGAELLLGFGALGSLAGFSALADIVHLAGNGLLGTLAGRAGLAALLVGLPGLAMGAVLPLGAASLGGRGRPGQVAGSLYGALSAGNVIGALLAGYVLVPWLGTGRSIAGAAWIATVLALGLFLRAGRRVWAGTAAVALGVATAVAVHSTVLPVVVRVAAFRTPHARLLDAFEGVQGTVTVSAVPPLPVLAANRPFPRIGPYGLGYRLLAVDAVQVAGTAPDLRTTQILQAHVPLLVHGGAGMVLQIGYGSGETAAEAALHGASVTVVELNRDVVAMARRWFPGPGREGMTFLFTDAKLAVRTASVRWDVILNDSTYPGTAGSSQLYSEDHFRACREHLRPGGVVSTWVPVDLPPETFRTILASFTAVFPRCSFWLAPVCLNKHGILVGLASVEGNEAPRPAGEWPGPVRKGLERLGIRSRDDLLACRILDDRAIRALAAGAPPNTDDRPVLEYPSRGVRLSGEAFWGETLGVLLPHVRPGAHAGAVRAMLEGQRRLLAGDPDGALAAYAGAARLWPASPWPANLRQGILVHRAQRAFGEAGTALARGDRRTALRLLEEAVALEPDAARAHGALGRLLLEAGVWSAAAAHLDRAVALARDSAPYEAALADALRFSGDPVRAERLYRRVIEREGAAFERLAALSDAVDRQGRLDEAIGLMRRAVALAPDREDGVAALAGLLERAGRRGEAVTVLQAAVRNHPRWTRAASLLAALRSAAR